MGFFGAELFLGCLNSVPGGAPKSGGAKLLCCLSRVLVPWREEGWVLMWKGFVVVVVLVVVVAVVVSWGCCSETAVVVFGVVRLSNSEKRGCLAGRPAPVGG